LLDAAEAQLAGSSETARLDAQVLLAEVLARRREQLIANPDQGVSPAQRARFLHQMAERARGLPVAYLTGHREFWSLDLEVNRSTLIPRPETELLVEQCLAAMRTWGLRHVLDLGTGSGAVALALGSETPQARIVATDRCAAAVRVAMGNAVRHALENVRFLVGDWYAPLAGGCFDLITCNPPYVANSDPSLQRPEMRFEPRLALLGGADGLAAIRCVIAGAPMYLRRGGRLILEHGHDQGPRVRELFARHGFAEIASVRDLADRERVTGAVLAR
jgi:release factor glutamine methyltransferase